VGCAEERDPINRVQAGVVPKTFFVGKDLKDFRDDPEFRTKSFNIDSAANTESFSGTIGGASSVERVRWEVTEDFLFARRAYQEAPGADNRGLPRKEVSPGEWEFTTPPDGTIVGAWKIEKHFDIRRDYNPSTGEEQNVIQENDTDRPWQSREYMRVDWSQNLAKSTAGDTSWVFGGSASPDSLYYETSNETNSEDRPHFELDEGYFDITNKYSITPEPVGSWGIPECVIIGYFNGSTTFDCSPTEVKARHSFVRLTGNEDFEPFEESNAQRDVVGNWGNAGNAFNRDYGGPPRTSWDPQYGFTDANTKTFYAIHNIWEKSHLDTRCDGNEDTDHDGTADQCTANLTKHAGHSGSQCDTIIGKCTIPVRDRQVKTIAYWLNADAPQDLADDVDDKGNFVKEGVYEEITSTWNQIFKNAVAVRREVECRRTHDGNRDDCHAEYFDGTEKEMIRFGGWGADKPLSQDVDTDKVTKKERPLVATCHNPVRSYDLPLCGKPGEVIRLGDLRKNYTIYWPYASRAPYGGVASIAGDPTTGEMLGVTATTMMRSASYAAALERDILQLAMGDLKMEDLIAGVQATRYADRVQNGQVADAYGAPKSGAELARMVQNLDLASIRAAVGETEQSINAMKPMERQLKAALIKAKSSPQGAGVAFANERYTNLMNSLSSVSEMKEVTNKNLKRLLAQTDPSSNVYKMLNQVASQDPARIEQMFEQYQAYLANKGVCFYDSINTSAPGSIYLPALAPYFKKLYGSLDPTERGVRIYKDLLRDTTKGIVFHEVGHSLGLRHNFASSWDSMNYPPQYWQLRTNEGKSTAACSDNPQDCMGPRYLDPMTPDEMGLDKEPRPGIEYFANTSTMEYQIERAGESVGAGLYDLHAMKTLYGRTLETFDAKQLPPSEQQYFALLTLSQGIPDDLVLDPNKGYGMHYTKVALKAKVFDPKRDCRDATDEEKEVAQWRIVHGKVCAQPPKNHLAYQDMVSSEISFKIGKQNIPIGANGVRYKGQDYDGKTTLYRWQYRYGEDYSAGGYIHAKPFDSGADIFEITQNVINRFENQYAWAYFRRQNKEFAWWSLPSSIANATFARIRGYHWTTTTNIGRASNDALQDDDQDRPSVVATQAMFNFLQRAVLTPEPGTYTSSVVRGSTRPGALPIFDLADSSSNDSLGGAIGTLGIVDGRFVQTDFDNDKGGSWDYFWFPNHASYDDEKTLALKELVDSRPTLSTISRDNALDGRDPMISFRTDTPWALDRLLGGLLSEDWETIGPSMNADGQSHTVFNLLDKDSTKLARPADSKGILFPNIGYSGEVGAGIYAMLFSRFSTDMVLAQKLRVRYDGDPAPTVPADSVLSFRDPVTKIRYVSTRYGTETIQGRAVERGIASRMLQYANELLGDTYEGVGAADTTTGERSVTLTGNLPVVKDQVAEKKLRRYIGFLDAMRQVGNILGGGPLGGGGGGDSDE
jgi:hypothetical protein